MPQRPATDDHGVLALGQHTYTDACEPFRWMRVVSHKCFTSRFPSNRHAGCFTRSAQVLGTRAYEVAGGPGDAHRLLRKPLAAAQKGALTCLAERWWPSKLLADRATDYILHAILTRVTAAPLRTPHKSLRPGLWEVCL